MKVLSFNSSELTEVPLEVLSLSSSEPISLDLSSNRLSSIPAQLFSHLASSLVSLDLSNNAITAIPDSIGECQALTNLNLSNNRLVYIPSELGWLPLTNLTLLPGNPQLRLPAIVLERGHRALMSYLQVICEQHKLVESHLSKFGNPDPDPSTTSSSTHPQQPPTCPHHDQEADQSDLGAELKARIAASLTNGAADLSRVLVGMKEGELDTLAPRLASAYVLDVRNNDLEGNLPSSLMGLSQLVVLNASGNRLSSISELVPGALGVLNLSFNQLRDLPESLGHSPVLQQVYLSGNYLEDLPSTFSQLPMFDLFLSENLFSTVPAPVMAMKHLSKLSIACCRLSQVPEEISALSETLRFLDLSFNVISSLPIGLSSLSSLVALNVSFNPLKTFPSPVTALVGLRELNLDNCDIEDIHPGIGNMRLLEGLQIEGSNLPSPLESIYASNPLALVHLHDTELLSLNLSSLNLPTIPTQLSRLTTLQALNLSGNKIEELSPALGALTQLTALDLRGNPLKTHLSNIAEALDDLAFIRLSDGSCDKLDLSHCSLAEVPSEIRWHAKALTQLKLPHNEISTLPEWFNELQALGTIVMDSNLLEEIPQSLLSLPKLTILMIADNKITLLPDFSDATRTLQAIMLPGNSIPSLPPSIGGLTDLKAISLASNALTSIPEEIGNCPMLRLVDFTDNLIESLPDSICSLDRLKSLKMANNKIEFLPDGLTRLNALADVTFSGNPFKLQSDDGGDLDTTNNREEAARIIAFLIGQQTPISSALSPDPSGQTTQPPAAELHRSEQSTLDLEAQVSILQEDLPPPPAHHQPRAEIKTVVSDAAKLEMDERASMAKEKDAQDEAAHRWLYIKKHQELVARDTIRSEHATGLENVSLMQVPTIFAVISNTPSLPDAPNKRPQALYRYKRLADQGMAVTHLIDRINMALSPQEDKA